MDRSSKTGRARQLLEATVRLPPRGRRYVAVYTGATPGQQVWRSTGETDRAAALAKALAWEAEARRRRAELGLKPRRPSVRAQRGNLGVHTASPSLAGLLTQREVAMILRISERAVRNIEHRALAKLRRNPDLRGIWAEIVGGAAQNHAGVVESIDADLDPAEVAALFGLVRTEEEHKALTKLLAMIGRGDS